MAEERRALRENLFTALGELGDRQAVPVIIPGLRDYEKNVRAAARLALARLGGPEAEDALIGLVEKSIFGDEYDSDVRQIICELGSMDSVRAMPILRLMIEQGRQQWAPLAAHALRQLGDTVTAGDMVEWLSSPDCDLRVRVKAAGQLGRLGDHSVVPLLSAALQDEDEEVRRAARRSLDALAEPRGRQSVPQSPEPDTE